MSKVTKHVDFQSRLVIPKFFLKELGIEGGDAVSIELADGAIIIEKKIDQCKLCRSFNNLQQHPSGNIVCTRCLQA